MIFFRWVIRIRVNGDTQFVRIGFKTSTLRDRFVFLQTSTLGYVYTGSIIRIQGKINESKCFDGQAEVTDLRGRFIIKSPIKNGHILSWEIDNKGGRESSLEDPTMLPEVVVFATKMTPEGAVGYTYEPYFSTTAFSSSTYLDYSSKYGGYGQGSYYAPVSDYYGGSYYSAKDQQITNGDTLVTKEAILADKEIFINNPAIDVERYMRCFDQIPDAGATCTIELFTDIPVDSDPNKLVNWQTESPGHCFIQFRKENTATSVSQNIGFYPTSNWKTMFSNAPVPSKMVDNEHHEFNASIKMTVSASNFRESIIVAIALSKYTNYDVDEWNCTDYALGVFNASRAEKLVIPLYEIPGGLTAGGSSTPQGLYNRLKEMKAAGGPEAANIEIPGYKGWVGESNGPCN